MRSTALLLALASKAVTFFLAARYGLQVFQSWPVSLLTPVLLLALVLALRVRHKRQTVRDVGSAA